MGNPPVFLSHVRRAFLLCSFYQTTKRRHNLPKQNVIHSALAFNQYTFVPYLINSRSGIPWLRSKVGIETKHTSHSSGIYLSKWAYSSSPFSPLSLMQSSLMVVRIKLVQCLGRAQSSNSHKLLFLLLCCYFRWK